MGPPHTTRTGAARRGPPGFGATCTQLCSNPSSVQNTWPALCPEGLWPGWGHNLPEAAGWGMAPISSALDASPTQHRERPPDSPAPRLLRSAPPTPLPASPPERAWWWGFRLPETLHPVRAQANPSSPPCTAPGRARRPVSSAAAQMPAGLPALLRGTFWAPPPAQPGSLLRGLCPTVVWARPMQAGGPWDLVLDTRTSGH